MMVDRSWTIAVPLFNGARHLRATLTSIRDQAQSHFDWIIVDDRSTDGSVDLAREVVGDSARVEVNGERLGLARNWGRCVDLCMTRHLAIVHQDDLLRPDHLTTHERAFQHHPDLGMAISAVNVINEEGQTIPNRLVEAGGFGTEDRTFPPGAFLDELAVGNPVRCSAVALAVKAIREVGGFDPGFCYVVDWDAWIKIARRFAVAWLAHPTVLVRWHDASETHRFKTGTEDIDEQERLLRALHDSDTMRFGPSVRRSANRRLARAFLNRAYEAARSNDPDLSRACVARSFRLGPGTFAKGLLDPRLVWRLVKAACS